jgi:4-hydroxy-tetrahydrodipicolinate reductase
MIRVGLIGFGKAGRAVSRVLAAAPEVYLRWIACRPQSTAKQPEEGVHAPIVGLDASNLSDWLDANPIDALVDFSSADSVHVYGEEIRRRKILLISAISSYSPSTLDYIKGLGRDTRVVASPNITLGINFLILAARLLRAIAPFADVQILEQHFKEKSEVSGTARKIAESLSVHDDQITSLRLGGIVGHHEVIFGFPHQTVRLTHDSIRREAFGTGALFALKNLMKCPVGFYNFEELMTREIKTQLLAL